MRIIAIAVVLALFLPLHLSHAAAQTNISSGLSSGMASGLSSGIPSHISNDISNGVSSRLSSATAQPLDINTASAEQLAETLPGIGPAKALRIVQWREQNGLFDNVEQLQEVKGIGPKTLEKLRALVRVGTAAAARKTRLQHELREEAVQVKIHRIIDGAKLAAQTEVVSQVPARPWFKRSVLSIMRTH